VTLPYERTCAIIQTEAILIELSKDKSVPPPAQAHRQGGLLCLDLAHRTVTVQRLTG
jgi:hypothetical protein